MLIALLMGLLIGFILALPPGPVGVTAMRVGLDKGIKHGSLLGLGTGLLDFFYCFIAIFAASAALSLLNTFFDDYPLVFLLFQMAVVLATILYGVVNIKAKEKLSDITNTDIPHTKSSLFLHNLTKKGPFLLGIAIALANVANPTFLPSLAYITMNIHKFGLIENTMICNFLFAVGFGLGNFFWLHLLIRLLVYYKSRMSTHFLARIHQFAGFTLIGFGTLLGYRVLTLTKWSEIVRLVFAF